MDDFKTTVSKPEAVAQTERPPIHQTIEEGDTIAVRSGGTNSYSDTFEREIPEEILAKIDSFKKAVDEEPVEEVAVEEGADGEPAAAAAEAKPDTETKPETPPAEPAELVEYRTRAERLEEANRKLVADLETARKQPREVPEPLTKLSKAAESYLDDDTAAIRQFIAHAIGVDDPNDKAVDAELEWQHTLLTAKTLGVTPDPSHLASRENARTRQLLARQKRERQVEGQTSAEQAKAEAEAKAASTAHQVIGNRLQTKRDDGRLVSDEYPLLMSLAETFDGLKPAEILWRAIQVGIQSGRLDPKQTDDALTEQAAKLVEDNYRAKVQRITQTQTKPTSTDTQPTTKASSIASKDRAPVPARNVTNADASVAPATPPAKAPKQQPPKQMTKEQRKEYALRHLQK